MRQTFLFLITLCLLPTHAQTLDVDRQLDYCHQKVTKTLRVLRPYNFHQEPRNILNGQQTWNTREAVAEEWCSGFWPGILWMDYSYTHDKEVRRAAEGYTEVLTPMASQTIFDHDLGFIMLGSFGKGMACCSDMAKKYKPVMLEAADTLATLYNAKVGTLLSWPRHVKDYGGHNTIMDNMINLDLLYWAAANGGSPLLAQIATTHATTTMRHHFRPDGSCYHVVIYDTLSGQFLRGVTHQGYSNGSMWSRGQSLAIYGYTMVYRWTHDPVFLQFAQTVTDIYLRRLHETSDDMVPLWDMDDPRGCAPARGELSERTEGREAPKDASAACVVASALLELSTYLNGWRSQAYREAAVSMLTDLSSPRYLSGETNDAFLLHSTGHHPAGSEIDASIIYADYYYLEALLRLKNLQQ